MSKVSFLYARMAFFVRKAAIAIFAIVSITMSGNIGVRIFTIAPIATPIMSDGKRREMAVY